MALLKSAGYKFILGGRIKKEVGAVKDWLFGLAKQNGCIYQKSQADGEKLIVSYSEKRAAKDAINRQRGIDRLEKAYRNGKVSKKNINPDFVNVSPKNFLRTKERYVDGVS